MKHSSIAAALLSVTLGSLLTVSGSAQSLGEAARNARKNKPAEPTTKVITNDDLSTPSSRTSDSLYNTPESSSGDTAKPAEGDKKKAESPADAQEKLDKTWKEKFNAQKDSIAALEKELATLRHDSQTRASNFYGDAGTRLRNEAKYAEEDRKSRETIAAKQKQLDGAKTRLEQMKDEARKAGASPGAIG